MIDTKLLDGSVEDVKAGLSGLDSDTLAALLAAEQAGQNRKGAVDAITKAQTAAKVAGSVTDADPLVADDSSHDFVEAQGQRAHDVAVSGAPGGSDTSPPAEIAPAEAFEPSGAPIQTTEIDMAHPALDTNPRANTTADQNRIDFNDPTREGVDIVTQRLAHQSS